MTLGHLLVVFAAVDLIVTLLIAMAVGRSQADLPLERQNALPRIIAAAGIIGAAALCLLAFYLPAARQPLF